MYFIYRYFFSLGFLDGKEGLMFHFLHGFWYRFLVDAKIYEWTNADKLGVNLQVAGRSPDNPDPLQRSDVKSSIRR